MVFRSRNVRATPTLRDLSPRVDPYREERERIRQSRSEGDRFDPLSRDLIEFYSAAPSTSTRANVGWSPRRGNRHQEDSPYYNQPTHNRPGQPLLGSDSHYLLRDGAFDDGPRVGIGRSRLDPNSARDQENVPHLRLEAYHRHLDAEERAGRRISPANQALIDYYSSPQAGRASARRQETPSPTPFLGRESSSPNFTGSSNPVFLGPDGTGETFLGSQAPLFTGRGSVTDYRLFSPQGVFLGRGSVADPASSETVVGTSGIADGIAGMMGGGLVGSRTPFRKGRAMDRMVSEMTRNISRR